MAGKNVRGSFVGIGARLAVDRVLITIGYSAVVGGNTARCGSRIIGIVGVAIVVMGGTVGREDEFVGWDGMFGVGGVPLGAKGCPGKHLVGRQVGMAGDDDLHGAAGVGIVEGIG